MLNTNSARALVRRALNLPSDNTVGLDIDETGNEFRYTVCALTGQPAAVHVRYWRNTGDDLEPEWSEVTPNYCWDVAADEIAALLADPEVDHHNGITVIINSWYLVYGLKVAA